MKKALCPLCNTRHMLTEPHSFVTDVTEVPEVVTKVISIPPETVTEVPLVVTKVDPVTKVVMGRPRKYGSHAERQAAYRKRKEE